MSILSNCDILKEIGINIYIYPFKKKNLKGASYNLTVSKLAWDISTGASIYDTAKDKLIIPPSSTVLIETNESIWVSNKIAGTYHSKVALVSKGLSHIGTTLDPEYIGSSLIAVHNHSDKEVLLIPEKNTFVTLKLHYLCTEASSKAGNDPGRSDILRGSFQFTQEQQDWLDEDFRKTPEALKDKLQESSDFKEILDQRSLEKKNLQVAENKKRKSQRRKKSLIIINLISASLIIIPAFTLGILFANETRLGLTSKPWYTPLVNGLYTIGSIAIGGLITANYQLFSNFSEEDEIDPSI